MKRINFPCLSWIFLTVSARPHSIILFFIILTNFQIYNLNIKEFIIYFISNDKRAKYLLAYFKTDIMYPAVKRNILDPVKD